MTAKRNNLKQHLSTAQLLKTSGLIIGNDEINNEEKTLPRDSARNYFDTSTSNIIKYLVREVRGNNNNDSKFDNSLVQSHYIAHSHGHSHVAPLFKVTRPFCCVTLLRIPAVKNHIDPQCVREMYFEFVAAVIGKLWSDLCPRSSTLSKLRFS